MPHVGRHAWYGRPESAPLRLRVRPRLASRDAATSRPQQELTAYLADTEALLEPLLAGLTGPWALRLDVGIPLERPLLEAADLDNYAYPLARHLLRTGSSTPQGLVSVWCTKRHDEHSYVRVEPATIAPDEQHVEFSVRTTTSATTTAFKQQIHDAARRASALPEGPVRLELSYVVSKRNWINLWKPTIDALDPLLGRTVATRRWYPRDGRITELGLHVSTDHAVQHDVQVQVRARNDPHQ
jgi:hypothetical protein